VELKLRKHARLTITLPLKFFVDKEAVARDESVIDVGAGRVLGKTVLIATDADDAGEKAAVALRAALDPFGAECVRVDFGAAKDANAFLIEHGPGAALLSDF
jgi:hypothetical protein